MKSAQSFGAIPQVRAIISLLAPYPTATRKTWWCSIFVAAASIAKKGHGGFPAMQFNEEQMTSQQAIGGV